MMTVEVGVMATVEAVVMATVEAVVMATVEAVVMAMAATAAAISTVIVVVKDAPPVIVEVKVALVWATGEVALTASSLVLLFAIAVSIPRDSGTRPATFDDGAAS